MERKNIHLDLTRELKKIDEHDSDVYSNYYWCSWYIHQRFNKVTGGPRFKRTNGDHPNYCITEIGHNTEKSHGDLKRFAVTLAPMKDHQPTLM